MKSEDGSGWSFRWARYSTRRMGGWGIRASAPDGKTIAFVDHPQAGDDGGAVTVVDLAGKKTILSDGWDSLQGLAWSPDGSEIWFTATRTGGDRSLYATDLSGKVRLLARVPGELTILDVGKEGNVLLTRGNDRAGMIGLAPGEPKEKDLSWLDWSAPGSLSADGKMILFFRSLAKGADRITRFICEARMDRRRFGLGEGSGVALSPDGQWALSRLNVVPSPLVLYPTGVGEMKQLKNDGLNHMNAAAFLPDGKKIRLHWGRRLDMGLDFTWNRWTTPHHMHSAWRESRRSCCLRMEEWRRRAVRIRRFICSPWREGMQSWCRGCSRASFRRRGLRMDVRFL